MEVELIKFLVDNGFSLAVTLYLLYERSKFNERIAIVLDRISEAMERIEQRVK